MIWRLSGKGRTNKGKGKKGMRNETILKLLSQFGGGNQRKGGEREGSEVWEGGEARKSKS